MESHKNCLICHHITSSSYILANYGLCKNCFKKMPLVYKNIKIYNYSCLVLYEYTDFIREIILRIKGYGDKNLAAIFINPIKDYLNLKYSNYILLPCPSTLESDKKRGFNHVKEIFKPLNLHMIDCFKKIKKYKQSNQSKYSRAKVNEVITVDTRLLDKNKNYLIVDDITTTHQTLKTCIKLLEKNNIKNIKLLVICSK